MSPLKLIIVLLAISLGGCVTYYHPRYADEGVYYGDDYYDSYARRGVAIDPVYYPYWSLDYFYFSYYRHPYSVLFSHDPFFRPYPGWYYGYRPGRRFHLAAGLDYWYPWYGAGFYYHYYRPWYWDDHYRYHYHHHAKPAVERRQRAVAGARDGRRGRDLYRGQQQDIRDSFVTRTDRRSNRRTLRDDGIPRPFDRTPARRLANDSVNRRPATSRAYPARRSATTVDRRARTRRGAVRTQRGIPVPQRRAPSRRPARSQAPAGSEPARRASTPPASRPSTPARRSAPSRASSSPPARSRSKSGEEGRRRR